jgi:hypothetical protein
MLTTIGFVVLEFYNFPMFASLHVDNSNMAPTAVGVSAMMQILLIAGFEEYRTNEGNVTMETMSLDPDRVPGNIRFDPMGYKKKALPTTPNCRCRSSRTADWPCLPLAA